MVASDPLSSRVDKDGTKNRMTLSTLSIFPYPNAQFSYRTTVCASICCLPLSRNVIIHRHILCGSVTSSVNSPHLDS